MRLALLTILVASTVTASAAPPERHSFALYKWQQRIGREDALVARDDRGTTIRTVFSFTDRTTPVPLAASLRLGKDGTPQQFVLWGSTSRPTTADDRVELSGKNLVITQRGETRTVAAPPVFFVGSAYAPVAITEELLRYWTAHGKPEHLPVFPIGEVTVVHRGEDSVTDESGKARTLQRYALGGLGWGRQTVWLDETGGLAALKGVDAEFDHFEATGFGFNEALGQLVAHAAEDGMASLVETSDKVRQGTSSGTVAYVGARLIDGTGAAPVEDSVVVTDGAKIVAAGPRAKVTVPSGARTVDVSGKTLLPGLWDMHAHFEQVEWGPLYLAAGVTTVRDCGNELDFIRAVRDAIDAGKGVGPRILLACIVDGEGRGSVGLDRVGSPEDVAPLVAKFKKAGCRQVKIYSSVSPKLIAPLSRAAHAAGMTVTGHVPNGIGAVAAVEDGMDMINHIQYVLRAFLLPGTDPNKELQFSELMRGIDGLDLASPAARKVAAFFAAHKTVLDPTLALDELFSRSPTENAKQEPGLAKLPPTLAGPLSSFGVRPELADVFAKRFKAGLAVIGLLHKLGVPIVTGTDQAVPGHSEKREIELYVEAGFTPMEAIQAATLVPARALKLDKEVGTVTAGKRADLIVVDGDPLADIKALRKVVTVVAAGVAYDPGKLWQSVDFKP